MKSFINLLILALCLASGFPAVARSILTEQAAQDFNRRLSLQPQLRDKLTFPSDLTESERDAITFLYAYLPTSDIVDYDRDFFLENVRLSLKASDEMPWGKSVPDREWRHFVLPVRVNNEDLDLSRGIFYDELRSRIQGMSMEEAILEVNHWCHEKVSYQPSDQRTSSPLSTVANALGRCGEESTFTVAALRSVGIPARQVYTPRWAHTDDNHAWVEAWADGKWHFLGACEPEAVLDLAWFNAPAARGMLMTTSAIGAYDGPEEQIESSALSTVINVTENYAPVAQSSVSVTDAEGNPLQNIKVRFCLYNYAEFYPLAEKSTDCNGLAQFTSGLGDLIVWASDGENFNLSKIKAGDTLRLQLDKDSSFVGTLDFDLTPPTAGGAIPTVSQEAMEVNDRRKIYEDSIRNTYTNSFPAESEARQICRSLGLDERYIDVIVKSRANHYVIEGCLREAPDSRVSPLGLLDILCEKDLHDITPEVIRDNVNFSYGDPDSPLFKEFILNPRIEFELLRPFKQTINGMFTPQVKSEFKDNPELIADFIRREILTDSLYSIGLRQSPVATLNYKIADPLNKKITFVAICRSLGIPSRLDPVSGNVQYADTGVVDKRAEWHDVNLSDEVEVGNALPSKTFLHIDDKSNLSGRSPKYYSQFTLSGMTDGFPQLMEFEDFEPVEVLNNRREEINPGQYFLLSGQRLADGTVLARGEFFRAESDAPAHVTLEISQDPEALQVIGNLNAELTFTPAEFTSGEVKVGSPQSILSVAGRGYYVLGIILPGHEPSAHAINDISAAADELSATGRKLLLLFPDADSAGRFRPEDYGQLPKNLILGIDNGAIAKELKDGLELATPVSADLPIIVVADSFNRIIFSQQGYEIRIGEKLAHILNAVSN